MHKIIHTFLLAATSKYGPFRLTSASFAAAATAFLLADKLLGLFKLLLLECCVSMAKSLFCLDESRCEPCTVNDRWTKIKFNRVSVCTAMFICTHGNWTSNPCTHSTQLISPTLNFVFNTHNLLLIKLENFQPHLGKGKGEGCVCFSGWELKRERKMRIRK